MWGWLARACGCGPAHSEEYRRAAALFSPGELDTILQQGRALAPSGVLEPWQLLAWCGLQGLGSPLADGLLSVVARADGGDAPRDAGAAETAHAAGAPMTSAKLLAGGGSGPSVTLDAVVVAKSRCECEGEEAALEFSFSVLDPEGLGTVPCERLAAVLESLILLSLPRGLDATDAAGSAAAMAAGVASFSTSSDTHINFDGFRKAAARIPAMAKLLTGLLGNIGRPGAVGTVDLHPTHKQQHIRGHRHAGHQQQPLAEQAATTNSSSAQERSGDACSSSGGQPHRPLAPLVPLPELIAGRGSTKGCSSLPRGALLRPEWVWLLAPGLPPDLRQEWRLLFSSARDGASFTNFAARVTDAAPTLLLVRDKGGYLFGGIAHAPWRRNGAFFGDYANALLTLLPAARVYPASGINANLQWFGTGFSELPNGLGFGGQMVGDVGHFGCAVDDTLERGHSRPNATYASPSLSSHQDFEVDAVEAWLLKPPEEDEEAAGGSGQKHRSRPGGGGSILSKAQEDEKLLELGGVRVGYSAAIRDEPLADEC